jgi:hypothetical protein
MRKAWHLPPPWLLLAAALLPAGAARAEEPRPAAIALTVSTNSFVHGAEDYPVPPGLYARAGLGWLPGGRLEFELFQVPRLVPEPFSEAFTGFSAGCWLFQRKANSYFNSTVDLAVLVGLHGRTLLAARLCPIVLGGPYYRYADRLLAVALVWEPEQARAFLQLQVVGLSLFLP